MPKAAGPYLQLYPAKMRTLKRLRKFWISGNNGPSRADRFIRLPGTRAG